MAVCAYCLEPLNDGAKACRACGRRQPATEAQVDRRAVVAVLAVLAALLVGVVGYAAWDELAFENAADEAGLRSAFCGHHYNRGFIEQRLRQFHNNGASWATAADMFLAC